MISSRCCACRERVPSPLRVSYGGASVFTMALEEIDLDMLGLS